MINITPPQWTNYLGTPDFDAIFKQKLREEILARKGSISRKVKVNLTSKGISVTVSPHGDQNSQRDTPHSLVGDQPASLEASAGVRFIVAEAVRDAFKKTIEEIKSRS